MFSPLSGTVEDAATGSAATPLAALLLSLGKDSEARYDIVQGVEMGRPSRLLCTARRGADGIRATVGGGCVPVLKGEISL
jgi:trans-2,3-dihydro-3-hydroxyanthranilate isomerase